jgi:dihydrofolate reductase
VSTRACVDQVVLEQRRYGATSRACSHGGRSRTAARLDGRHQNPRGGRCIRYATTGAILVGRRMFDVGVEPWGDPPPFGMPVFVLTHEAREPLPRQGGTTYLFATTGLEEALEQAKAAAGDRGVGVWGGASIAQQYLGRARRRAPTSSRACPAREGVRLFGALGNRRIELKRTRTIETAAAIHLRFAVEKGGPK